MHNNLVTLSAYRYVHGFAGHVDNVALAPVQQPAARVVNGNGIVLLFTRDGYPAVSGKHCYLARFNVGNAVDESNRHHARGRYAAAVVSRGGNRCRPFAYSRNLPALFIGCYFLVVARPCQAGVVCVIGRYCCRELFLRAILHCELFGI